MDVGSNEIVSRGLSMPHSPRWYGGKLWLLPLKAGKVRLIARTETKYAQNVSSLEAYRAADTIDRVLEDMMARSRELKLRLAVPEDQARQEFTVLLTVQAMNHLHSGGHRLFL